MRECFRSTARRRALHLAAHHALDLLGRVAVVHELHAQLEGPFRRVQAEPAELSFDVNIGARRGARQDERDRVADREGRGAEDAAAADVEVPDVADGALAVAEDLAPKVDFDARFRGRWARPL
jgi:hypothetical protein